MAGKSKTQNWNSPRTARAFYPDRMESARFFVSHTFDLSVFESHLTKIRVLKISLGDRLSKYATPTVRRHRSRPPAECASLAAAPPAAKSSVAMPSAAMPPAERQRLLPGPTSLLSLPEDALCRILDILDSPGEPEPSVDIISSRIATEPAKRYRPRVSRKRSSGAAGLVNTCKHLRSLFRTRVVRRVDFSESRCACRAAKAMARYTGANTLLLGRVLPRHCESMFDIGAREAFAGVTELHISAVSSVRYADALISALPQLQDLEAIPFADRDGSLDAVHIWPEAAVARLFGQLPVGLTRVRAFAHTIYDAKGAVEAFEGADES